MFIFNAFLFLIIPLIFLVAFGDDFVVLSGDDVVICTPDYEIDRRTRPARYAILPGNRNIQPHSPCPKTLLTMH